MSNPHPAYDANGNYLAPTHLVDIIDEQQAEVERLRAALDGALVDLNYISAMCSEGTNRKTVVDGAAFKIYAALTHEETK